MPNHERPCVTIIGQRLRAARKRSGLDAIYIADHVNYSGHEQVYWSEANCKFANLLQVAMLCKLYGITLDSLVEGLV